MNIQEFSVEFDIWYNNIRSASAPGLDNYEKSVFLTEAQEQLVLDIYSGTAGIGSDFEDTELSKRVLDNLIGNYISTIKNSTNENISPNSTFFSIPEDVLAITNERLLITSDKECFNNIYIDVVPLKIDEYNSTKNNPFKKPKLTGINKHAWRLDFNKVTGFKRVEIVYPEGCEPTQYLFRYLRKPKPIILEDLSDDGLSIDGLSTVSESEIDPSLHRKILKIAVTNAKSIYDPKIN